MTDTLPQLLRQLSGWLGTQQHAGRFRSDNHTDPHQLVDRAAGPHHRRTRRAPTEPGPRRRSPTHHPPERIIGRDAVTADGPAMQSAHTDQAGIMATSGQFHGHQRAGFLSAGGQKQMSLDTASRLPWAASTCVARCTAAHQLQGRASLTILCTTLANCLGSGPAWCGMP
jgi:hypothetical protein